MSELYDRYEVLQKPFDVNIHKKVFVNYLELVITEDGIPHYANPSHTEYLYKLACDKLNMTRNEIDQYIISHGLVADFVEWMIDQTNAVLIWFDFYKGKPNQKQCDTINMLIKEGVMFHEMVSIDNDKGL